MVLDHANIIGTYEQPVSVINYCREDVTLIGDNTITLGPDKYSFSFVDFANGSGFVGDGTLTLSYDFANSDEPPCPDSRWFTSIPEPGRPRKNQEAFTGIEKLRLDRKHSRVSPDSGRERLYLSQRFLLPVKRNFLQKHSGGGRRDSGKRFRNHLRQCASTMS